SVSMWLGAGETPCVAVLSAEAAAHWAREGLLLPLDGCLDAIGNIPQEFADVCAADGQLMFVPLAAQRRMMAVRPDGFQAVNMGYLLDSRAHPVWYPSEFLQALDEMALVDAPGMEIWPPQQEDALWLEALLQGIGGGEFADETTGAYVMEEETLTHAFEWLREMLSAGLIETSESREEALARFVSGETAVFADWTAQESERFAQAVREGEILLRPYPSLTGTRRHAAQLTVVCAFASQNEQENALYCRAAALFGAAGADELGERRLGEEGTQRFAMTGTMPFGATLRMLLCGEARRIIKGETDAESAAGRITRAMRTAGY
ncbi:MAG: extracellular solute-binding protein, partial [Clostridia bacterium]|nr:extracellular solute-binding protein [Clostridia bacterium]